MGSLAVHSVESNKLVAVLISQDGVISHEKWVEFKDYWKTEFKGTPLESVPLVLLPRYTSVIVLEEKDKSNPTSGRVLGESNGQEVQQTQEVPLQRELSPEERDQLRKQWQERYGGGYGIPPKIIVADGRDAPPTPGPQPTTTDAIVGVSQPPTITPIPQKATEATEAVATGPVFTNQTIEKVE